MWIGKSVFCKKFPFDAQTSLWPLISREAMMIMIMIMMIILHHYPQHHHHHNFDGIYHGYATSTHLGCSDDDWLICVVGEAVYIWDTSPQISVALDITSFTIRSGWAHLIVVTTITTASCVKKSVKCKQNWLVRERNFFDIAGKKYIALQTV